MLDILEMIANAVASVLGGVLLLRFWMQSVRIRPPIQVGQFLYTLSDWLVKPLRRVMPGFGGFDWASLLGAFLVAMIYGAVFIALRGRLFFGPVLIVAFITILQWVAYGFTGLILLGVVFSWVNPHAPNAPFVFALSAPVLRPLRRIIPPVGGLDLSPMVALLILQIFIFKLIPELGRLLFGLL